MREQQAVAPSAAERARDASERRGAQEAVARIAPKRDVRSVSLLILCILAIIYTLYLGKEIILPIVLAVVLKLLLQPVMRVLTERLRLPGALAALLIILAVFGALAGIGFAISVPASDWIAKTPESFSLLREKLGFLRQPLDYAQSALKELESATAGGGAGEGGQTITVRQGSGIAGIAGQVFSGTATTLSRFFTIIVVLFFLLATGDRLLRGFVEVLPSFEKKRKAVEIANEIETNISGYLLTITIMNTLVGIATGLAMQLCGLGDPLLWGTMAFFLNFIPILGPLTGVCVFSIAGMLSFDWAWHVLLPPGLYLMIHIAEGETITPMLLARRFTLNPVLVIISIFLWHTIWGIPGALLAVPLLAMFKIVSDRIEPLKPIGHIIGS